MKKNGKIRNHIFYYWYVYVLIAAVVGISDWFITRNITAYRNYEKLSVFVCAADCDKDKMESVIRATADDSLKEVNIWHYSPNESSIGTIIQSVGTVNTDFMIMPKDIVENDYVYSNCLKLYEHKDALNAFGSFNYVKYDREDMAIEVYNKETSYTLLDDFITYNNADDGIDNSEYVLLINDASVNFRSIKGSGKTDHATVALKSLLDYEEEN